MFESKVERRKRYSRSFGGDIFIFILLSLFGIFTVLPFVYAIIQSIKPINELFIYPPRLFVSKPTLDNFYMITQMTGTFWVPVSRYIFNSVFITIIGTLGHVLIASMAAFPLAKYKFAGSKVIFNIIVLSLLFTGEVTYISQYIVFSRLNLIDSIYAIILPALSAPLGLFLMKQFMMTIPDAIIEAATVDGANTFRTYISIIMPQVKPAWLTLIIFSFKDLWNKEGLEFIYSEQLKTLPTVLKQMVASGISQAGTSAAVSVILMLPPIIVFIFSQSNVIETMAYSGIKE